VSDATKKNEFFVMASPPYPFYHLDMNLGSLKASISGFAKGNSKMDKKSYERLLIGIGQVLAEARASSGMTQGELGKKLDKVQSAVAKIERAPSPNIVNLSEVCKS